MGEDQDERLLICFKCLAVNKEGELRRIKIKRLTLKESMKHRTCKACKGRTFYR